MTYNTHIYRSVNMEITELFTNKYGNIHHLRNLRCKLINFKYNIFSLIKITKKYCLSVVIPRRNFGQ